MARLLEITYTRSAIGRLPNQRRTIEALGLRKLHDQVQHEDNPDDTRHDQHRRSPCDVPGTRAR